MTLSHPGAMRASRSIVTVGEGADNIAQAVLEDEPVPLIAQSIANGAIVDKDQYPGEVGKVSPKAFLCGCNHSKAMRGQGQRWNWVAAIVVPDPPPLQLDDIVCTVKNLRPLKGGIGTLLRGIILNLINQDFAWTHWSRRCDWGGRGCWRGRWAGC